LSKIRIKEVLYEFKILRYNWEGDETGWVISIDNKPNKIVLTDHGKKYIAQWKDLNVIVEDYKEAASETNNAISLL